MPIKTLVPSFYPGARHSQRHFPVALLFALKQGKAVAKGYYGGISKPALKKEKAVAKTTTGVMS